MSTHSAVAHRLWKSHSQWLCWKRISQLNGKQKPRREWPTYTKMEFIPEEQRRRDKHKLLLNWTPLFYRKMSVFFNPGVIFLLSCCFAPSTSVNLDKASIFGTSSVNLRDKCDVYFESFLSPTKSKQITGRKDKEQIDQSAMTTLQSTQTLLGYFGNISPS